MYYFTARQSPRYHQMSIEDLLFGENSKKFQASGDTTSTVTYERESIRQELVGTVNVNALTRSLEQFNERWGHLREVNRHDLYTTFYIPKKTRGMRKISAPKQELMTALRDLKDVFESRFHAMYHASAFAYIKGRSTIDCVKKHQSNESRWFAKLDLHNFFGSTTSDFVMEMLSMIFPFSEVMKTDNGRSELELALELAFLDGGLPQGTPVSPLITNVMMIPIDFKLSNSFRDFKNQRFVYTRYADDFIISSRYHFDVREVENEIKRVLSSFDAPFTVNEQKTRYGSSSGSNWNLGVMLNKDNTITVGAKNKRRFAAMISNYARDKKSGIQWPLEDIQAMQGLYSYYKMVEGETINSIVSREARRAGIDILREMKQDLRA